MNNTIIRIVKVGNYVSMDKGFLNNPELSIKAKGLLAYLLTLPNDWKVHLNEIVTHHKDGIDTIKSTIKELKKFGHIVLERERDIEGKFVKNIYTIFEVPQTKNPQVGNPLVDNPTLLSTNKKLNTNNIKDLANYKEPIEVLNKLTGRSFKIDNETYLKMIRARVKDGSPIEEVIEVVKSICKKRMGTKFEEFLRPSTVFNRTKYDDYKTEYKFSIKDLTNEQKYAILNTGTFKDLE